jgi:LacI family transcriptional regulator
MGMRSKMASQREIAERAKTSLKTVSRVINGDPLVNARTRARIEAIIAEIGYEPSQAARMMRSQKSNIIGFLAAGVATTSSSIELIRGAQDVAWERGKQMMLFNIERDSVTASLAQSQLAAFRAEAIIYAAIYHQQVTVSASSIPHVLLNCFDAEGRLPSVIPDDRKLGFDLANIIFDKGYRHPVFLNLADRYVASSLRAKGFVEAAAARGLDVASSIHIAAGLGEDHHPSFIADQILPRLFSGPERPDLILCAQDILALDVYSVLSEMGLRVGRDVAIASFDNLEPIASLLRPGLSTMELPYYEMGRRAMTLAIDRPHGAESIRLGGRFVERASM